MKKKPILQTDIFNFSGCDCNDDWSEIVVLPSGQHNKYNSKTNPCYCVKWQNWNETWKL